VDRLQQIAFQQVMSLQPRPTSVLEVGCGGGRFLERLADALPQADIVGVDVAEVALRKAARALEGWPRIRVINAAAEDLPLPSDGFDVVVANKSFHHWHDWGAGLGEANRVLRPCGALIIADALAAGAIRRPWAKRVLELIDGGRFVDEATFDAMLGAAGFASVRRIRAPSSAGTLFVTVARPFSRRFEQNATS
jgi:ubiquinone/menaquinone biosynthesis C-methylase UbiE